MPDALPKAGIDHRMLVTDFWVAYDSVTTTRHQCCLAHLLGELKKVSQRYYTDEWNAFAKKTKRLFQDALRLRAREDYSPETYAAQRETLYRRLPPFFPTLTSEQ